MTKSLLSVDIYLFLRMDSLVYSRPSYSNSMYSNELTLVNLFFQFVGIFSNIYTCRFIRNTFDIHQSLYRILWIDSITIIISEISSFLVNITIVVSTIQYGHVACFILGYLTHLGFYISPMLVFLISFIRYDIFNIPFSCF